MPEYPDQPVNIALLDEQLQALSLPGYEGVSRLTKRRLEDGTIEPSEPYLLVRCDDLTKTKQTKLDNAIAAHDATQETDTQRQEREAREAADAERQAEVAAIEAAPTLSPEVKDVLLRFVRSGG